MIRSISAETAAQDKFLIEGPGPKAWIHNYINDGRSREDGSPRAAGDNSPMIYLVDQEPNSSIDMHFHQVDQYQIVVGGSGSMGRYPLTPITIHYASPYTGYGPLKSGPDGLQYLTIRSRWDPGLRPLPEARNELPPSGSYKIRHRISDPSPALDAGILSALDAPLLRHIMREPTGKAEAWMLALPANGEQVNPASVDSDRVLVVCSGTLSGTTANAAMSCHFLPAGEEILLRAGSGGADILILQFPNRDPA